MKLRDSRRIPSRVDVEAYPPRLSKGYEKIPHDVEENMPETVTLYRRPLVWSADPAILRIPVLP